MKSLLLKVIGKLKGLNKIYFSLLGIAALLWFLLRVIPKPSRASYPCQRVAFPIASGFIIWISVNVASFLGIKQLASYYKQKGKLLAFFACIALAIFYFAWLTFFPNTESNANVTSGSELFVPTDSANSPIGIARGIFPGRVVWAFDTTFSKWTVTKGKWWDSLYVNQVVVSNMIANSIHQISGKENDTLAWDTIFKYFNYRHGKGNVGYTAGEKIAIKLSLVQSTDPSSDGGNINFTPPQTVLALLRQLVYKAGVDADNITFYDAMRSIPTSVTIRCKKEFPKVHFAGSEKGQYQEAVVRSTTTMHWSEPLTMEINGGNTAYLPTIITQASYIINLANLKGHHLAGITCCTKNHNGSFLSDGDPNTPHAIGMHCYFTVHDYTINGDPEWSFKGRDMGTYNCFVDVMGHKDLGEKTMLFIIDGLYSVPSEGVDNTHVLRWQQTPFNNHFSSSIFMSQDNVAIESVALDFFRTEQAINPNIIFNWEDGSGTHNVIYGNVDNYLHEAAQADNPTSGTVYEPNGDGVRISSLGVHEHWNNAKDKQYTRNLFVNGTGIELVSIPSNIVSNNKDTALNATFTISSGGNPVKNAKIVINGSNFFTNEFGKVTIENLKSKSGLQYKVSKNGYSDVSGQVDINENVDVNIELTVGIQIVKYLSGLEIFPNPFKTEVNIKYNIEKRSKVSISIYNTSGQLINTIVNKDQNIGNYIQKWVPSNSLLQGIYFVEISLNNIKSQSMKISYVK